MRKLFTVVLVALVLGACGLLVTEPTTTVPADTSSTSEPDTTTTTEPTTTSSVSNDLVTTSCPTDDEAFTVLCEAVTLIEANYVDPVDLDELGAAAADGVDAYAGEGDVSGTLTCALPAPSFQEMCEEIDEQDVDPSAGVEAALRGMFEQVLDANSGYLTPEALELTREEQTGQVEGIGALVTTEDLTAEDPATTMCPVISDTCRLIIVSTLAGSPAEEAGLQPNDQMIAVDGESIDEVPLDIVTSMVRGPAGSDVTLTFLRGDEEFDVTITRAAVDIPILESEVVGGVGYVRLNLFTLNADEVLRPALQGLLDSGVEAIVFDLRDNPGGSLTSSVEVASEFLTDGLVLITEFPDGADEYSVTDGGVATDGSVPLYVLVNRGSASASEVVSGVLQESGRATIIGETTFGKNTVQQRFDLSNGGAVKVTIARWKTPGGTDLGEGVSPDIAADLGPELTPEELVAEVLSLVG